MLYSIGIKSYFLASELSFKKAFFSAYEISSNSINSLKRLSISGSFYTLSL